MATKLIRTQADFTDFSDSAMWREELNKYLQGREDALVVENWHEIGSTGEPAFNANFSNTSGYETAAYRKVGNQIFFKGRVDHSSNMNGVAMFQITDTDYLPTSRLESGTGVVVAGAWTGGIVDYQTDGTLIVYGTGTITSASINVSFYLDN